MKELAYGASHEINNPLANISARAQTLLRDEARSRAAAGAGGDPSAGAARPRDDLRSHAVRPPAAAGAAAGRRAASCCAQVQAELAAECRRRDDRAAASTPTPSCRRSMADAVQLAVAVKALVRQRARSDRPRRAHRRRRGAVEPTASRWQIVVRDDGPGIPADVRPHIFDPFYSGREAGRGLGFGLSKCWRIVTEHGGRVTVGATARTGAPRSRLSCRSTGRLASGLTAGVSPRRDTLCLRYGKNQRNRSHRQQRRPHRACWPS